MALALGSIASKFTSNDNLTAADRAYIEDFRNVNDLMNQQYSFNNVPNKFQDNQQNPYHQKLKQQKQQILQQNQLLKRFQKRTRWKRFLMWSIAIAIVTTIFVVVMFLFSNYIKPEQYVKYFAILISTLALIFIVILIGTYLARQLTKRWHPENHQDIPE